MNMQLTPAKPTTEREALEVRIGGELIGVIKPWKNDRWHASLNIPVEGKPYPDVYLIQGFANDPEEAVKDAFRNGAAYHQAALVAIADMQRRLDGAA